MASSRSKQLLLPLIVLIFLCAIETEAGVIKDIFQKITGTNNKTQDNVRESAPICGSGVFSTPDELSLSPELIFITNRPARSQSIDNERRREDREKPQRGRKPEEVNEVAREFSFHAENVTLRELEQHGFNRDAPASFLIHGFTSGYPLQAWISAIVESYTIDRQSPSPGANYNNQNGGGSHNYGNTYGNDEESSRRRPDYQDEHHHQSGSNNGRVEHNLFIVNWNYAARGILYPRAVANIPIVASYVTRFINDKLLGEARMDPRRIQLIGHSLGAHLAGFVGKNTESKLGRIYGLDPAGPCFGAVSGPLYPASKRLAPSDAEEVITVQTNSALLGIDKPLGRYSVFVEGGAVQPGCKGGTDVIKNAIGTLTWDGSNFDSVACSHSRAPNLLTHRHDQSDSDDECQLVAYECKDWDSFVAGQCGQCSSSGSQSDFRRREDSSGPLQSVECLRVGLDWQYPGRKKPTSSDQHERPSSEWQRPNSENNHQGFSHHSTSRRPYNDNNDYQGSSRRPNYNGRSTTTGYINSGFQPDRDTSVASYDQPYNSASGRSSTRRPSSSSFNQRDRRDAARNSSNDESSGQSRRRNDERSVEAKKMFLRTGDTQPYCSYHYQVVLELHEPFGKRKPPMSLILQDSERRRESSHNSGSSSRGKSEQNSLTDDEFGVRFNDRIYTDLLTSSRRLKKIDHATILFREGAPNLDRILKALHVNYMSHVDPGVRRKLSARLCPVKTETDRARESGAHRFYFEACEDVHSTSSSSSSHHEESTSDNTSRRPHLQSGDSNY